MKAFPQRLNCKIQTAKLKELFNEVDNRGCGEISFDDFAIVYQRMLFIEDVSNFEIQSLCEDLCILQYLSRNKLFFYVF